MIFIVFFHTKPFFVFVQWLGDTDTLPWVIVTNKMLLTKSTNVVCFHPPPHPTPPSAVLRSSDETLFLWPQWRKSWIWFNVQQDTEEDMSHSFLTDLI